MSHTLENNQSVKQYPEDELTRQLLKVNLGGVVKPFKGRNIHRFRSKDFRCLLVDKTTFYVTLIKLENLINEEKGEDKKGEMIDKCKKMYRVLDETIDVELKTRRVFNYFILNRMPKEVQNLF